MSVVSSGGILVVSSGSHLDYVTVDAGGEIVFAGGTVEHLTLAQGAREAISGATVSGLTADNDQAIFVENGEAIRSVLKGFSYQEVLSGATARGTVVSAGAGNRVSAGAVAIYTIVNRGGYESVDGGTAIDSMILKGGGQDVASNGSARDARLAGGDQYVDYGGSTTGTRILKGGLELVQFKGTALSSTINGGGLMSVTDRGVAQDTVVDSGGFLFISGGIAEDTVVSSGGVLFADKSGTVKDTVISSGGIIAVQSGGTASGIEVLSGAELMLGGGHVAGVTVAKGGKIVSEIVSNGVTSSGVLVSSRFFQEVLRGGTAIDTTVLSGGDFIYAGGEVSGLKVDSGGIETVASRTTVSDLTVGTGATLLVLSGGRATNTDLDGGTEILDYGAASGGTITFGRNATLQTVLTPVSLQGFGPSDGLYTSTP